MKKIDVVLIGILLLAGCRGADLFYITNVNIVDVAGGGILSDRTIVVEDGVIKSISAENIPSGGENTFDGNGMYVTPGLSDMNVFLDAKMMDRDYWKIHPGDQMIAAGVTNIRLRNFFKDPGFLVEHEAEIRGNMTAGPDIIKSTVANYSSGKDIENLIAEIKYAEADYINILSDVAPEQMNNIIDYAEEHNIYTRGNLYSFDDFSRYSENGFNELEKIDRINVLLMDSDFVNSVDWFDENDFWKKYDEFYSRYYDLDAEEIGQAIGPKLDQVIEIMKGSDIAVSTSLIPDVISALKLTDYDEYLDYARKYDIPERPDTIYLWTKTVLGDHLRLEMIPDYVKFKPVLDKIILKRLHEEGVLILAATSFASSAWYGMAPGIALHDELDILLECGFSNLEALQTATLNVSFVGAKMGLGEKLGIIEPGYRADIIFTTDNPLDNIEALRTPECVMKSGVIYTDEDLRPLRYR